MEMIDCMQARAMFTKWIEKGEPPIVHTKMATADLEFHREAREKYPAIKKRKDSDDYGSTDEEGEEEAQEEVEEQPPPSTDEGTSMVA